MKQLMIITGLVLLASCDCRPAGTEKFKEGDIVTFIPDTTTKAIITRINGFGMIYVSYVSKNGVHHYKTVQADRIRLYN